MEIVRLAAVLHWVRGAGHSTQLISHGVDSTAIARAVARTLVVICFQVIQLRSRTLDFGQEFMVWSESHR